MFSLNKKEYGGTWFTVVLLFILSQCGAVFSQDQTELEQFINDMMVPYHLPGVAACAVKDGDIIWMNSFGFANIQQNISVNENTLFMLASISKNVTGVAFMKLYEQGLIGLDDDVNNYLSFNVRHPNYPDIAITPRMLLSHVSGIKDNWNILGPLETQGTDSPIRLNVFTPGYLVPGGTYYSVNNFNSSQPGTIFDYTNVGTTLIAYLVEVISQMTFEQYCQENIFLPLEMDESSWFLSNLNLNNIAVPYGYTNIFIPYQHYGSPVYPCGFLRTSISQFSRYLMMLMQKGEFKNTRILNESTIDTMMTLHYPSISPNYGFFFQYLGNFWGHGGGSRGVATRMFFDPIENIGAIVLINIENSEAVDIITSEVLQFASNFVTSIGQQENETSALSSFILHQNYPNPFNPSTTISFQIPELSSISLTVYDVLGNEIAVLVQEERKSGKYEIEFNRSDLSSGVYFYQLRADNYLQTKKMILLQ
jgi:CubicO group peptidase (beta-lactamase class C family)